MDKNRSGSILGGSCTPYIETTEGKANFRVIYDNTFGEPVGFLMNALLTEVGRHYHHIQVGEGHALVVDHSLARSVALGIQSVTADLT